MKWVLPLLLSFNSGYVDVAGFLALSGLFTSHVTGNFATLGASLVLGTSGMVSKLLSLPVFCAVIFLVRALGALIDRGGRDALRVLLAIEFVLLVAGAGLALLLGPFPSAGTMPALVTGLVLVAAMGVQNAIQRIHLAASPPTTVMTSNSTQFMVDLADVVLGQPQDPPGSVTARLGHVGANILTFIIGSAAAAGIFAVADIWCFVLPPLAGLALVVIAHEIVPAPGIRRAPLH